MAIEVGKAAPLFTLKDQDGNKVALRDFRGKNVLVYFYPRDNTPGCNMEAKGFRDLHKAFEKTDTVILGISPDGEESHQKFIKKFKLPFTLLCDPNKKVMEKYEAYGKKILYGKISIGVIRSTVWVGPNGKVVKHWRKVPKAASHPQKALDIISAR